MNMLRIYRLYVTLIYLHLFGEKWRVCRRYASPANIPGVHTLRIDRENVIRTLLYENTVFECKRCLTFCFLYKKFLILKLKNFLSFKNYFFGSPLILEVLFWTKFFPSSRSLKATENFEFIKKKKFFLIKNVLQILLLLQKRPK